MKNLTSTQKGAYLACLTALISGFSVFLSKFATKAIPDSSVFTTAKNIGVALVLCLIVLLPSIFPKLKHLTKKDWLNLILIGIIGGSIPFLLFFKGLSISTAPATAFIHKTLFIWVAILAVPLLKEKISKMQLGALGLLLAGNFLLGSFSDWRFDRAGWLVLAATLFWAVEYVLAKKMLARIDAKIVAWARMFFGSIALIGFVLAIGKGALLISLNYHQLCWIGLSSCLLLGYVLTWYRALKYLPATAVTCILVIASPVTTALNSAFITHKYSPRDLFGAVVVICAAGIIYYAAIKTERSACRLASAKRFGGAGPAKSV
ncbi:MAG: DMT family transporter [Parcubacteria group bacterium]